MVAHKEKGVAMNTRKFRSDKDALIAEGIKIVSSTDDAKYIRKVTIVNLMLNGLKASELSPSCGETTRTLTGWMKSVDEFGFESLRTQKQPGRPKKLSEQQKEEIKVAILSDPSDYGLNVWDGPGLSDYISRIYGISLCVRQCQRLLHELGFSLIRPQTFPSKEAEDTQARNDFKKNSPN